jgi:hypothetical protein
MALVAPGLPLPILRKSTPRIIHTSIQDKGRLPRKKASSPENIIISISNYSPGLKIFQHKGQLVLPNLLVSEDQN